MDRPIQPKSSEKIPVGISTCLLGEPVRYNGDHKRDKFVVGVLADYFKWTPVCPEVEIGLGTPREAIRLVRSPQGTQLRTTQTDVDLTEKMSSYSQERVKDFDHLRGYILKKDSPSCGMQRVRLYDQNDVPSREGVGLYAEKLMAQWPNLPIEEEGRLNDPLLRENFITRVFTYKRWRDLKENAKLKDVIEFHTAHKMLLMAHNNEMYREMGRLVAEIKSNELSQFLERYEEKLMGGLRKPATRRRHVNVLQHLAGFLKEHLDPHDKDEVQRVIEEYRLGWTPLIAPLTLLQHHLKRVAHPWVAAQIYLEPYPRALALRSQV